MDYATAKQAAITEDASRASWSLSQWRAYFRETATGQKPYRLKRVDVLNLLGPTRGSQVLDAVEQSARQIYAELAGDGLDLTHRDAPEFLAGLQQAQVITADDVAAFAALTTITAPRHQLLGLPEPLERDLEVEAAMTIAAEAIRTEDAGTTNHAARVALAKEVNANPQSYRDRFVRALVAQNDELTTAQVQAATDSAIITAVTNAWNLFI